MSFSAAKDVAGRAESLPELILKSGMESVSRCFGEAENVTSISYFLFTPRRPLHGQPSQGLRGLCVSAFGEDDGEECGVVGHV
jgi:hypothetical protein